jgi:hypothetical protein
MFYGQQASKKLGGGRRAYQVSLLWVLSRLEDSISGLMSGPSNERISFRWVLKHGPFGPWGANLVSS